MSPEAKKLLDDALQLPTSARAALAAHLLQSLDTEVDEGAEAAWSAEIAKRLKDLETGKVKTIPWSEARSRIMGLSSESRRA
ncbi:MAG: addiction module protein [Nitrospirota bacterium]|nr:addiction module protein [Nitrospirota bacterium]